MSKKYGIKVMIAADDWVWVTKDQLEAKTTRESIGFAMLYPVLFESFWEAEEAAQIWRKEGDTSDQYVKVVEYNG